MKRSLFSKALICVMVVVMEPMMSALVAIERSTTNSEEMLCKCVSGLTTLMPERLIIPQTMQYR